MGADYKSCVLLFIFVLLPLKNRVWDLDGNENTTLRLRSPGISVCWHPEEAFKVGRVCFRCMLASKGRTLELFGRVELQCCLPVMKSGEVENVTFL